MFKAPLKAGLLPACCLFSIVFHVLSVYAVGLFGRYELGAAVKDPAAVTVELGGISDQPSMEKREPEDKRDQGETAEKGEISKKPSAAEEEKVDSEEPAAADNAVAALQRDDHPSQKLDAAQPTDVPPPSDEELQEPQATEPAESPATAAVTSHAPAPATSGNAKVPATALAGVGSYLSSKYEKLSYRISMHGIPVATAELEAKNEPGMTTITMKVQSNGAISSVFPVDDLVESRQMGGLYLMTKIRQQEGSFRSDETFTINLRKKTVTWYDLVRPRIMQMTVPTDDVLDSLSGIYYLRNRDLQVGKTETLHIFDGESYADVPVEVLRREEVRLPNLSKVATLVVRPLQKTAGIFRRTGEVQIWMTDDRFKVPVRIETAIALGKVTAELVSAESKAHGEERREASR